MIKVNKLKYGVMMVCEKTFTYNKELGSKLHLCTTLFTKDIEKVANGYLDPIYEETHVFKVENNIITGKEFYRDYGLLVDIDTDGMIIKTIKDFLKYSDEVAEWIAKIVNECKQIKTAS